MPRSQYLRVVPLLITLVTGAAATARAQGPPPPEMHATGLTGGVFRLAGNLGRDFSAQATYPFRLARDQPLRFTLGATALLGLVAADNATRDAIASPEFIRDHGLLGPARQLSSAAGPTTMVPLALAAGAIGLFGPPRERETGGMLVEALITSSAWTGVLKYACGRERPRETTEISADWTGPGALFTTEPVDGRGLRSFPSGHTSGAWAMATVLAHQYPSHGIVPVIAYGAAAAMGYSRMAVGAHWLSDVVAGGLIGYGCARQVISAHEGGSPAPADDTGWHLYLGSDGDVRGGGLVYQF
ncbi:MAG TPA: phosphatase PAP2 family protein [Candidatus Krumholzibacteria bacterium]